MLGTELPGPGTIFLHQCLNFEAPVGLGDTVAVRVEVTEKQDKGRLFLACTSLNQHGKTVIIGVARVIAPREKVRRTRIILPKVYLHTRGAHYARLIAATETLELVRSAVVHPCDALSLGGALDAVPAVRGITTRRTIVIGLGRAAPMPCAMWRPVPDVPP